MISRLPKSKETPYGGHIVGMVDFFNLELGRTQAMIGLQLLNVFSAKPFLAKLLENARLGYCKCPAGEASHISLLMVFLSLSAMNNFE